MISSAILSQADAASGTLVTLLTNVGVGAAVVAVLLLWLNDVKKERDKAVAIVESMAPVMQEALSALKDSNKAHAQSAAGLQATAEGLKRVPSEDLITRMTVQLERLERRDGG